MTYATRQDADGITLWCSEQDAAQPPAGFVACDWPQFVAAWQARDRQTLRVLLNPYTRHR